MVWLASAAEGASLLRQAHAEEVGDLQAAERAEE
jgi:hypothetical protein